MKNWRIGMRLAAAFAVVIAILIGVVWLSLNRMSNMNDNLTRVVDSDYEKLRMTHDGVRATLEPNLDRCAGVDGLSPPRFYGAVSVTAR